MCISNELHHLPVQYIDTSVLVHEQSPHGHDQVTSFLSLQKLGFWLKTKYFWPIFSQN